MVGFAFQLLTKFPFRVTAEELKGAVNLVDNKVEVVEIGSLDGLVFLLKVEIFDDLQFKGELIVRDDQNSEYNAEE